MKWSVGTKIGAGFAVALTMLCVIGARSYVTMNQLIENEGWVTHTSEVIAKLQDLLSMVKDAETGQRGFIITGDDEYLQPFVGTQSRAEDDIKALLQLTADNPAQKPRLDKLVDDVTAKYAKLQEVIDIRRKDRSDAGFKAAQQAIITNAGKQLMDDIRSTIAEAEDDERTLQDRRMKQADASIAAATDTILFGIPLVMGVTALVGFFIARNISVPLKRVTQAAEQIAAGDLNVKLTISDRQDEVGVLAQTFRRMVHSLEAMAAVARQVAAGDLRAKVNPQSERDQLGNAFAAMIENLRGITANITEGAGVLGSSASEIVASTAQLASSSSQTAAAVTETTTTMEEVRQTAQVASQKAKDVSDSSQRAAHISQSGKKSVDETAAGMNDIQRQMDEIAKSTVRLGSKSREVGQIITAVDDLAQQSNLLAVNAAIEAAKAGEQGKGFAVVAQEVKSLSVQSKEATAKIRDILNDIQDAISKAAMATEQGTKAVEAGVKQSSSAGESIISLAGSVEKSAQAASQIAASSQQQVVGIEQVSRAMESIKQASGQNVDSAKQLEAAAKNLNSMGQRLKEMVGKYQL